MADARAMRAAPALAASTRRPRAPPGPPGERATPIPHDTRISRTNPAAEPMLTTHERRDTHKTHLTMIAKLMPATPATADAPALTDAKPD